MMTYYSHPSTIHSNNVLNRSVAFCLVEAVSTRLVECAECVGYEAGDVVFSAEGVVLEDFVLGVAGAAADDAELGVEAFGGEGVFADVFPPDWGS